MNTPLQVYNKHLNISSELTPCLWIQPLGNESITKLCKTVLTQQSYRIPPRQPPPPSTPSLYTTASLTLFPVRSLKRWRTTPSCVAGTQYSAKIPLHAPTWAKPFPAMRRPPTTLSPTLTLALSLKKTWKSTSNRREKEHTPRLFTKNSFIIFFILHVAEFSGVPAMDKRQAHPCHLIYSPQQP